MSEQEELANKLADRAAELLKDPDSKVRMIALQFVVAEVVGYLLRATPATIEEPK